MKLQFEIIAFALGLLLEVGTYRSHLRSPLFPVTPASAAFERLEVEVLFHGVQVALHHPYIRAETKKRRV